MERKRHMRDDTRGSGMEEAGGDCKMKRPKKLLACKRRGEPQRPCIGEVTNETSFHQTKLFMFFSVSSSLQSVDILQFSCPGSPALRFLSLFDKGDHGG